MNALRFVVIVSMTALASACASDPEPSASPASEPAIAESSGDEQAMSEPVAEPEPEPAPPAAQTAPPEPPKMPEFGAVVTHKVKDYDTWKVAFDNDEAARREAGIVMHSVSRDLKNDKNVMVWMAATSLESLEAFSASPDLKEKMKEAGVQGKPAVMLMKTADMSPPSGDPNAPMPQYGALIDHKVKDYEAWKTAFDANADARTQGGVVGFAVARDPKDEARVYVWLDAEDKDALQTFLTSKELKAAMKDAGVKGAPKITSVENVEFEMYQ